MDKNAIKKYAVWARRELIERVSQRALIYGITAKDVDDPNAESVNGHLLSQAEKRQRQALIRKIKTKGYEQVMEEVAYTWFNRFAALRFMEVNGYLPSHIRVFTNDAGEFKPQILTEAIHLELDGLDMNKVYELESANKSEELFKYLLIVQCNALNSILPGMFQKINDYTELLLPDYLLREGSVIERMIAEIPEANFNVNTENGQIEIVGWLYQYYISEKHEEVVDPIYRKEIAKDDVPAATQLFTTDWVVRYIVDNSIGRYWIERNTSSRLADQLPYFVKPQNGKIKKVKEKVLPQEITTLDPCVGSGHFLIYAFDVLMKIYVEYGYSEREAAAEIVKNNLYGIDIDGRATQLAYFSVMMKARQYDRRFFTRGIQPNVYEIIESNNVDRASIEHFYKNDTALKKDIQTILSTFKDGKEYGSILQIPTVDFERINTCFANIEKDINIYNAYLLGEFRDIVRVAKVISRKYAVVVTNPPYLNKYDAKLKKYLVDNYKDYAGDLFSVFMYRNLLYCQKDGYAGLMTPNVWMFIRMYEKLRKYIVDSKDIITLVQMAKGAFFKEATVDICAFVLRNSHDGVPGSYIRLEKFRGDMDLQGAKAFEAIHSNDCDYLFIKGVESFDRIPGSPIAYWSTEELLRAFESFPSINVIGEAKAGMTTGDNDRFLRSWSEVSNMKVGLYCDSSESALESRRKWFPYNKGGRFRKWYGLNELVVLWENNGSAIKSATKNGRKIASVRSERLYFKESITWATLTSGLFSARYSEPGHLFDDKGSSAFIPHEHIYYVLAFMNSKVSEYVLSMLNPTISFQSGNIGALPIEIPCKDEAEITRRVKECIELCKEDWDAYESSIEFKKSPLIGDEHLIENAVVLWIKTCRERASQLKENEEFINSTFIKNYGLDFELSPDVDDKDISIAVPSEKEVVTDLISYLVGCILGRYSLDKDGIAFAGNNWTSSRYKTIIPDLDGIVPICNDDYFEDDMTGVFISSLEKAFGKENLNQNLMYIASVLGGNGSPREVIRQYFVDQFYKDHLAKYSFGSLGKRPIYWLFDSGKKNGFKCLVYMHRYQPDTIARIRTDYVHEQQSRYRTAIADLEQRINGASTSERVKLSKQLTTLQAQAEEIRVYEEKIHHLADQMIKIDLDDGVKHNYEIFKDVLAKIK